MAPTILKGWIPWLVVTAGLSTYLGARMAGDDQRIFLPGETTHGHYQIEMECSACHSESFNDRAAIQASCEKCHGEELKRVQDSHPKKKFTDPRNADRVALLDARECVTCHLEHRPEVVGTMGLSLPEDYCYHCHSDIGDERASHKGLAFDSCADVGCHNFHDNQALYEEFLARHKGEAPHKASAKVPRLSLLATVAASTKALTAEQADGRSHGSEKHRAEWAATTHAKAGVNCTGCHAKDGAPWSDAVAYDTCTSCHSEEKAGFELGRHGMRRAQGLPPMEVAMARIPMRSDASDRKVGCTSCHGSHRFDRRFAAVDACLGCHDDDHSRAYRESAHFKAWKDDPDGTAGASCATCHLPRHKNAEGVVVANHNNNHNLRPREKMVRGVCGKCHGLAYTLDALADQQLVDTNFQGNPRKHVPGIDWARED